MAAPVITDSLLRITSATTFAPYSIRQLGGTLEVTGGKVLAGSQLYMAGGSTTIDANGTIDLTGHVVFGSTGAINGTIAASNSNARAVSIGSGSLLVNGGVVNGGTGQAGGNGGAVYLGVDGGGTPATLTVQSSGANAGVVTNTYTHVGSDPTSFGVLTLNGNGTAGGATWTDEIDPGQAASLTTGYMLVGFDNQSTLFGTLTPPPFSGTAAVLVENGATLTEQSNAIVGQGVDSAGSVQVVNALWNIGTGPQGGFLTVGDPATSSGTLEVDGGGTVAVSHGGTFVVNGSTFTGSSINVGLSAASTGTITVQNGGLVTDAAGMNVGDAGQGLVRLLNGGSIQLTGTNGISVGTSASGVGTLLVSGVDPRGGGALRITFNANARGISAGVSGHGTVDVESGGTIQLTGTGGFGVGQSANAIGVVIVNGPSALPTLGATSSGVGIAQGSASTGTVTVENGGTISLNGTATNGGIGIGQASNAQGALDIESGGTLLMDSAGNINVGQSAGATGLLVVNGANALLNVGNASGGLTVGLSGSGTLDVKAGGHISYNGTKGISLGLNAGASGVAIISGGTLTVNGTPVASKPAGVPRVNAGGTLELAGAVLNAARTTVTDDMTPAGTYTVNNSVVDVTFADGSGVPRLDDIAGFAGTVTAFQHGDPFVISGGTLSGLAVTNTNTLTFADSGLGAGAGGIDHLRLAGERVRLHHRQRRHAAGGLLRGGDADRDRDRAGGGGRFARGRSRDHARWRPRDRGGHAAGVDGDVGRGRPDGHGGRTRRERGDLGVRRDIGRGRSDSRERRTGRADCVDWATERELRAASEAGSRVAGPGARGGARSRPAGAGFVSAPDHAFYVNGVLVPVKLPINGTSIAQVRRPAVTYYHVELQRHAVILAEGSPVESYLDSGDRANFNKDVEPVRLFPDFAARLAADTALVWETRGAAKLVMTGEALTAARRMVMDQRHPRWRA